MSQVTRPVGVSASEVRTPAAPPSTSAPGSSDVFLHKAPDWVRYTPNPSLAAPPPLRHVNRHLDAPVLESFRPPPLHARLRFHPALYPQALERLRAAVTTLLPAPEDAPLRQRLDAHLQERGAQLRAYRREARKLLTC